MGSPVSLSDGTELGTSEDSKEVLKVGLEVSSSPVLTTSDGLLEEFWDGTLEGESDDDETTTVGFNVGASEGST